jgi:hypothetical protein
MRILFTAARSPHFRRTLRHWIVFQAFLAWQGGFVFYAGVVVPIGTELLGSAREQGFITQAVTNWLNAIGLAWHLILFWDLLSTRSIPAKLQRWRWLGWLLSLAMLGGLAMIHRILDADIDPESGRIRNRADFKIWHIIYLWLSTLQWFLALGQAGLTLRVWEWEAQPDRG